MRRRAALVAVGLCAAAAGAEPTTWTSAPASSALTFTAGFEGAPAPGAFRRFDASVRLGGEPPRPVGVDVTVATTSVDMGSDDVNRAIRGPDWFDVERHPVARFAASDVQATAPGRYVAIGTFTMKGVTQPLRVPFEWNAKGDGATMSGEFVVDRTTFGIGTGEWRSTKQVAGDVKVQFSVRLRKAE